MMKQTEFTGRTAEQILKNPIRKSSSWHFFQARSWLDYATRTKVPSAVQYAAFELRYGVEDLLFELLVLTSEFLTQAEYKKCIGDPHKMKKMLAEPKNNYRRLAEFTQVVTLVDQSAPKLLFWDVDKLFGYWGVASEFLHFVGVQSLTYSNTNWPIKAVARLDKPLEEIWKNVTQTLGIGVMRPSNMPPEVYTAWMEFSAGKLSKEDLLVRIQLLHPIMQQRYR